MAQSDLPELPEWKADCRHFLGDRPCRPHKQEGVHCADCPHEDPVRERIVIIKLGALGDVIRTTPILRRLRREHPGAHITWVTDFPDILPAMVDRKLTLEARDLVVLEALEYDLLLNLDKDLPACALASRLRARRRRGFVLKDGVPAPADDAARHKFVTGLFDDASRANRKHYVEEVFEIAGWRWEGEEYVLDRPPGGRDFGLGAGRPRIGLNTGCGGRWTSRLWPEEHWIELAGALAHRGCTVVLLGGADEDARNRRIAAASGAIYPGHFPLDTFMALVDQVDLVVTAVTMAMHIAIGLGKQLVLFNNIFNSHEFELYGRGRILEPAVPCDCYYAPTCPHDSMRSISPERTLGTCLELLGLPVDVLDGGS
ncbi:MAG: glycosyltransferase family 9 protein [Candidatus Eiseniibacteriota bacterium]|jgi:heptosyltransferase-2